MLEYWNVEITKYSDYFLNKLLIKINNQKT